MNTILLMDETTISLYLPAIGDKLAVKDFCRRNAANNLYDNSSPGRKNHMLTRLRAKVQAKKRSLDNGELNDGKKSCFEGNKFAEKQTRRLELGWMNWDNDTMSFKQVRAKTGGGIRHLMVEKSINVATLVGLATQLFFPQGLSSKGRLDEFETEMTDFKNYSLQPETTIQEAYECSKFKILRFYLTTKKKSSTNVVTSATPSEINSDDNNILDADQQFAELPVFYQPQVQTRNIPYDLFRLELLHGLPEETGAARTDETNNENPIPCGDMLYATTSASSEVKVPILTDDTLLATTSASSEVVVPILNDDTLLATTSASSAVESRNPSEDMLLATSDSSTDNMYTPFPYGTMQHVHITESHQPTERLNITLTLHRANILAEMISHFKDPEILLENLTFKLISPNGKLEVGDGEGVVRDCFAHFWSDFFDKCAVGNCVKVPFLRHDYGSDEWMAVGRIIVKGWTAVGYFPIRIASVVMEEALFKRTYSSITENFLDFVTSDAKEILSQCLTNFASVDIDDLMDVLEQHGSKRIPKFDNVVALIAEIAHKELIQEPRFIVDCWSSVFAQNKSTTMTLQELQLLYTEMKPNAKKVVKMLQFSDSLTVSENEVKNHLCRFVRELEYDMIEKFLRFCTGADMILSKNDIITVQFIQMAGLGRRPIAHTCGRVLELSTQFENFLAFRSEFRNVLSGGFWDMDIV